MTAADGPSDGLGISSPTTGATIADRYRLTGRIGRGGMADVYAAADDVLHRQVAIKLFRTDSGGTDDRRRIEAEVRTLAGLRHPGLVTVFDAGAIDSAPGELTPYLVMELVSGPTLGQQLASGPLSAEHTALLAGDLAATLAYVHSQGIVHRDVKPANILLDGPATGALPFRPKLTDFGIARLLDTTRMTTIGMTVGTANYLSPEQAMGKPTEGASDIYSLGLVLIECLTGKIVYPGVGVEAAMGRLHAQPELPSELGPRWIALLSAMTAREPAERPTATEVAEQAAMLAALNADTEAWTPAGVGDVAAPADPAGLTQAMAADDVIDSTRVMPATGGPLPPGLLGQPGNGPRGIGHEAARRSSTARLSPRLIVVLAALVVAIAILVGYLVTQGSGSGSTSRPNYPTVSGSVGGHLQQLEGAVG